MFKLFPALDILLWILLESFDDQFQDILTSPGGTPREKKT